MSGRTLAWRSGGHRHRRARWTFHSGQKTRHSGRCGACCKLSGEARGTVCGEVGRVPRFPQLTVLPPYGRSSGYRESDPTRRHRPMIVPLKLSLRRLSWGRAGSSRDMWPTELCVAPSALTPPRFLRPSPMILVWEIIWLPRERPNSLTSSDDGAAKSASGGYPVGRAGSSRDMWFHHPSQALPLTATVPRLPNGMERKAGRAYRSVLDLVVATCTAALVGAMSVVPPDPRRVTGVVASASRPCTEVLCTGESRRRQRSDM